MATRPLRKVFIVRLWADGDGQWAWQGEVQSADTGDVQRIHSAGELLDYLQERMTGESGSPALPPTGLR
ncbi:MAG: hypothetical protein R3E31_23400 [Chloroflexota bacterium]|nr:hypothetical protein [Anaerolineales bacterium]MCA9974350.1 hypothetical protein [Anaerolineales bacterium]MCB8965807.1 hypothetical protein [Ardenticatenaceae bacterium]